MSKKLNNLKWASVAVEGFPVSMTEKFQGFVGLEECTDYGMDKESKRSKKKKQQKRKLSEDTEKEVPNKKVKLNNEPKKTEITKESSKPVKFANGFIVESCNTSKPSVTNEMSAKKSNKNRKNKKKKTPKLTDNDTEKENKNNIIATDNNNKSQNKKRKNSQPRKVATKENNKKNKQKLGDLPKSTSELTPEDMLTWAEFKLPEPIMMALTELGFKQPTKIQQLTLPAAIHGRRDILGAAETGSGKTLAFGLPILSGILKLKEKAAAKNLDVYDIPYKKSSNKIKIGEDQNDVKKNMKKKNFKKQISKKKFEEPKTKESSEDGYSSGDESNDNEDKNCEKDFIEEIEVPIRKRENSADEGNDSDDDDNYIHLSDMLDSDDLAETSDDETNEKSIDESNDTNGNNVSVDDENSEDELNVTEDLDEENSDISDEVVSDDDDQSDEENEGSGDENDNDADEDDDQSDEENEGSGDENDNDADENEQGIGCVKVVDDIEMPGHVETRTGKPLYALILTPTRELAIQISRHLIAVAKYTGIKVATIVGGMAVVKQERVLRSGPEVVVATPGRLWELLVQGQPHLQQMDSVKFLAIDETDRMVERGHFDELRPLLERLNAHEARGAARQNFVFSATLTMVHDLPAHLKGKKVTKRGKIVNRRVEKMTAQQKINKLVKMIGMTEPKVVDITTQNLGTAETLTESRIVCAMEHKDAYLYYIIKRHPGRTIVFCNSIGSVRRLAQLLMLLKCTPLPLHASMPQRQRIKNLERFRDSPHGLLIATDVAARGLDVPLVQHVLHYHVPRTAESYVHRSGRTARAACEGLALLMMEPAEASLYAKLCVTLQRTSEVPLFPVDPLILAPIKELVAVARDLDALELKKRRAAQAHGWREKAARELDIIIDEDDIPIKHIDPTIDKALQVKRRQLNSMLSRPIYPKGFSFKYPTTNDSEAFKVSEDNALQVMKKALQTGQIKKEKRKGKNAPLLQLQKTLKK